MHIFPYTKNGEFKFPFDIKSEYISHKYVSFSHQSHSPTYFLHSSTLLHLLLSLSPPSFSQLETKGSHYPIDHTNLLCDPLPKDAPRNPGLLHAVLCLLSSCVSQSSIVVLSTSGSFSRSSSDSMC